MSRNKKEKKKLIKKWEESGLLDGIANLTTSSMAEMMESEAMQLLRDKWDKEENQNKDESNKCGSYPKCWVLYQV